MSGQIFISYRRDDAPHPAGRLYDCLSARFPQNQIFIDVDDLEPGVDFVEVIKKSVESCDALIAVIGKHWLISSDEEGKRRLDNPEDFVRIEIATALRRGIRVIPVLVEGASMPRSSDLPDDLKLLVRRHALGVSHERFRADSKRLIDAVERTLGSTRVKPEAKGPGEKAYDVHLVHNSEDKLAVQLVADALKRRGLSSILFNVEEMPDQWLQNELPSVIETVKSVAIFLGPGSWGKWLALSVEPVEFFFSRCTKRKIPVIVALLPGIEKTPEELVLLRGLNRVQFFQSPDEQGALNELAWNIKRLV